MIKFKPDWLLNKSALKILPTRSLQGQRVTLSPPCAADYADWYRVRAANQDFLKPYEPQWPKNALHADFFKRRLAIQHHEVAARRGAFFLIHDKDTLHIIGGVNLNNIIHGAARYASLGYWLDHVHQGQGLMAESVALVIDHAFQTLKLNRLNAACLVDNHRSINMLLKLGFTEEGLAKNYLQINGKFQDHRLFGLVRG